jgi:hypothetical protein
MLPRYTLLVICEIDSKYNDEPDSSFRASKVFLGHVDKIL